MLRKSNSIRYLGGTVRIYKLLRGKTMQNKKDFQKKRSNVDYRTHRPFSFRLPE